MRFVLFLMLFLVVGALLIISNHNLAMSEKENVSAFVEFYIDWGNQIYLNFQSITGNVVKLSWFPSTNSSLPN